MEWTSTSIPFIGVPYYVVYIEKIDNILYRFCLVLYFSYLGLDLVTRGMSRVLVFKRVSRVQFLEFIFGFRVQGLVISFSNQSLKFRVYMSCLQILYFYSMSFCMIARNIKLVSFKCLTMLGSCLVQERLFHQQILLFFLVLLCIRCSTNINRINICILFYTMSILCMYST